MAIFGIAILHCIMNRFFHPIKQQYARDIWQFDDFKNNEVAKDYKIFIIWENELHDTDGIINRFELYLQNCADK